MTDKPSLNPALKSFWTTPARNRVLYGGRSSSKSWDAAGFAIFLASNYRVKFLCTRQFQNRIADSVYSLLKIQAERFGLADQFKFTESSIIHKRTKSEFLFFGIARNLDEIKSTESVDIAWHEECHLMTEAQWKIINPTVRKEGSQHWLIFNPRFASDFVYKRFVVNPPPDTVIRHINYNENPFISKTMLDVIEAERAESEEMYRHIYLGEPLQDNDRAVIKMSWIEASVDAHKALGFDAEGKRVLGYDVADSGGDKCATVYANGSIIEWMDEWSAGEDELLQSCTRAFRSAQARGAEIVYDCIGVGAHAGSKFDELNLATTDRVKFHRFNAGDGVANPDRAYVSDEHGKVKNKDHFANIKAQAWWMLADRFRKTYEAVRNGVMYPVDELISLDSSLPHIERLKFELSTPLRDFDGNGRVKVESKKDLAKRGVKSPNLADALVMCYAPIAVKCENPVFL